MSSTWMKMLFLFPQKSLLQLLGKPSLGSLLQETAYNEAEEAPIQKYSVLLKSRAWGSQPVELFGGSWFFGDGCVFVPPKSQGKWHIVGKFRKKNNSHRIIAWCIYLSELRNELLSKPTSASTQCIGLFSLFTCTSTIKDQPFMYVNRPYIECLGSWNCPYHPSMEYLLIDLPTWMLDLYGKCCWNLNIPYMDGMGYDFMRVFWIVQGPDFTDFTDSKRWRVWKTGCKCIEPQIFTETELVIHPCFDYETMIPVEWREI